MTISRIAKTKQGRFSLFDENGDFLFSIDGCGCIHAHCFPTIHRDITQGYFHRFINQWFSIIQAYVTDIDGSTSTRNCHSNLFGITI